MSTKTPPNCPQCGAPLTADTVGGLCPRCVMALNFKTETAFTDAAAPTAAVPTPAELAPHFPQLEIIECLGRGGMGVVYKARQPQLDRLVALKILAPERVTDPRFAERFLREAQALARLSHPNIVIIHDFGQTGGYFYLLMEFVDGVNLRQAMKAGRLTPEQALAIVPPVCEALQYAHEHGIVHRDIKPENLLLDKGGRVKIADFGIAKMLHVAGSEVGVAESQPAGTPQYMAPEQKGHEITDHRADIYSLGVVLYELLTGELPAEKLQPPSRKVHIDVRLDEIVLRALEVKPELRFQTAAEMRTQLETVSQPPLGEAGSTPSPHWWTWSPRQPPLVREICAHMTVAEKSEAMKRGLLFGVWNAATFFIPFFSIFFLPKPLGLIFGIGGFLVGLSFYPLWNKMQREFLCATNWAKQYGIRPDQLRRNASAISLTPRSWLKFGGWLIAVVALATIGVFCLGALKMHRLKSRFGPTVQLVMPAPGRGVACVLDFEAGRLLVPPDPLAEEMAEGRAELSEEGFQWLHNNAADAVAYGPNGSLRFIEGVGGGLKENGRVFAWDDFTPAKVLEHVLAMHYERIDALQGNRVNSYASSEVSPVAMSFITRGGTMGVLEIFGPANPSGEGSRIRYKLLRGGQSAPTVSELNPTLPPGTKTETSPFGPVMYRTLNIGDNGYSDSLDPTTGKLAALPRMGTPWDPATNIAWPVGIVISQEQMVAGTSVAVAPSSLRSQYFDGNMGLEDALQMKAATVKTGATTTVANPVDFPKTFAFKTESGQIGLLQILWFTDNVRSVKLRYKLLKDR